MSRTLVTSFINGELLLHLRGANVSECLSALQQKGLLLQSIRVRQNTARFVILFSDFDAVYRTCRQYHVKFRIGERRGLPFLRKRLMRRKAFLTGAILFVTLIYALSSTVWRIDITGPKDEEGTAQIREAAKLTGLYVGQRTAQLSDLTVLQRGILAKSPDFVWVGVRRKGSVAQIQAIPKIEGVQKGNEEPQNIVADRPAVVRKLVATRGRVVVKPNTYVLPGQVLISGNLAEGEKNVPADGSVMAEVWYTSKVTVPLQVSNSGLTGESVKRDYVQFGGWSLRVWGFQEPHYAASYERSDETNWHLGTYRLPVQMKHVEQYEATTTAEKKSVSTARQSALQLARGDVSGQVGTDGRVLGQSVLHQQVTRGTLYETILTRVLQNIGVPAAIPVQDETKNQGSESDNANA